MKTALYYNFRVGIGILSRLGDILTSPIPPLHRRWLRLTLPSRIAFLEDYLPYIESVSENLGGDLAYEMGHRALLIYKARLSEVNDK